MPPTATTSTPDLSEQCDLRLLPIAQLFPSPLNPRKTINKDKQAELVASVRVKGVIEPLVVRVAPGPAPGEDRFEIVAGGRRYLAAKEAKKQWLPCVVRQVTDVEVVELALTENHQRADVHPLEEAASIQQLLDLDRAYTPAGVGAKLGVSTSWVYRRLKLLRMSEAAQAAYLADALTAEHADLLASVPPRQQDGALAACFVELLVGEDTVSSAIAAGRWELLAECLDSVANLKRWIVAHTTADITDTAVQEDVPELQDALADVEVEKAKLTKVSLDPQLSTSEAKRLGVVLRSRWIEVNEDATPDPGLVSNRRCESQESAAITHPPIKGVLRVVTICMRRSCPVHRPAAVAKPGEDKASVRARQADADEQFRKQQAAAVEKAKAWTVERLPRYLTALVAKIAKVRTPDVALVRALLGLATVRELETIYAITLTAKTAPLVLLLSTGPCYASQFSRESGLLEKFGEAFGLTPAQWEREEKAATKSTKTPKVTKPHKKPTSVAKPARKGKKGGR